jgi:hypothetical protein
MRIEPGHHRSLRRHHGKSKAIAGYKICAKSRQAYEEGCTDVKGKTAGNAHDQLVSIPTAAFRNWPQEFMAQLSRSSSFRPVGNREG